MDIENVIILSFLQAITEFLPISSSGHLQLAKYLLDLELTSSEYLTFEIVLHLSTLFAIIYTYRRKIYSLVYHLIRCRKEHLIKHRFCKYYFLNLIVASIPAGLLGFFGKPLIELSLDNVKYTGWGFFYTTFILVLLIITTQMHSLSKLKKNIFFKSYWFPFLIGLAQAVAIFPGVSRSGSCIVVALLLGVRSVHSVEFAFLMSIPVISGAFLLEVNHLINIDTSLLLNYGIGFIITFFLSLFFLSFITFITKNNRIGYFCIYTFFIALVCFII